MLRGMASPGWPHKQTIKLNCAPMPNMPLDIGYCTVVIGEFVSDTHVLNVISKIYILNLILLPPSSPSSPSPSWQPLPLRGLTALPPPTELLPPSTLTSQPSIPTPTLSRMIIPATILELMRIGTGMSPPGHTMSLFLMVVSRRWLTPWMVKVVM